MCGINGVYSYNLAARDVDLDAMIRVREHMKARGPDGKGAWIADHRRVGLAHRRLAIIDLSEGGHQPMSVDGGRTVITFNGEIYNYRNLRRDLEQRGHKFKSESDTEVLLRSYNEFGIDMVSRLQGMFAFALWDDTRKRLVLARDPYGIKPLYYSDDGWTVRFASQARALLQDPAVSGNLEPAGIVGFYLLGSVPDPLTLWQEIKAVPAGCTVTIGNLGACEPKPYFRITEVLAKKSGMSGEISAEDACDLLRTAVKESVRRHLVADVPVGIFLSSGRDSGALLGLMNDVGYSQIKAITVAFGEFQNTADDETPLAEAIATQYGAQHYARRVAYHEFADDLPAILQAMDQPSIDGINTWFASKAAKEAGLKVALSGLGADELLGGYQSFETVPRFRHWIGPLSLFPGAGRASRIIAAGLLPYVAPNVSHKAAGLVEYSGTWAGAWLLARGLFMPWEIERFLGTDLAREGFRRLAPLPKIRALLEPQPKEPLAIVSALESQLYMRNQLLRDSDWAGMAHGVEIRVPYVDSTLLVDAPAIGMLPNGKDMLTRLPSRPLPEASRERRKTGFSIPLRAWLRAMHPSIGKVASPELTCWPHLIWRSGTWAKDA
jgi:asparagine synthase (glutamine-hydrolysing)